MVVATDYSWPSWEAYAHLVADLALHQRSGGGLDLPVTPTCVNTKLGRWWRVNHAFIEGWSDFKAIAGMHEPQAYQAGQLARLVYDDRRTSVTRIIEFLAQSRHRRIRFTAEQINHFVFQGRVALASTRTHLRWCWTNGYVVKVVPMFKSRAARQSLITYRYRPAAARSR